MKANIYLATMLSALCVFNGLSYADFQPVQTLPGRLPSGSNVPIQTLPGRLPGGSNVPIQTLPGRLPGGSNVPIQTLPGHLPGGSNVPIQTLPGHLPGGSNVPIHTLPGHLPNVPIQTLPAIRQTVHSRLGVLLIRDQVTGSDYVTTLDSSSNVTLPGSPAQAIFGARVRGQGARKVATWYTHRHESNVVRIEGFTPREAFVGMTNENGNSAGLSGDSFILTNGAQVNPVLSGKAFSELINMPIGSSHELGFTEVLRNGDRQFTTTVYKRAQLELGAAPPQCKSATVEGISGKVCVLRTISGASKAQDGGDVMFSVEMRARMNASHARFRVGGAWHTLGQRVPVAEFANAKNIELFFVPPAMSKVVQRLSDLAQMNFSSASRLGRGDRFDIRLQNNAGQTPEKNQVLSHLNILTVRDKLSGKEILISLQGSEHQTLSSSDSSKWLPVWYLEAKGIQPLYPLVGIKGIKPTNWFSGIADRQGRLVASNTSQGVYPVLSSMAVHSFASSPIGSQRLFSAVGELNNGKNLTYLANVKKQAYVVFDSPRIDCHKESLNGVLGRRCTLSDVDVEGAQFIPKNIMLTLKTNVPLSHPLFFAGSSWHRIGEQVSLMSLAGNNKIDFFYVPKDARKSFPNLIFLISHDGLSEEISNIELDTGSMSSDSISPRVQQYRAIIDGDVLNEATNTFKFDVKLIPPLKESAQLGIKIALIAKDESTLLKDGSISGEIKSVGSPQGSTESIKVKTNDQWDYYNEKKIDAGADHYEIRFKGDKENFSKARRLIVSVGSGQSHISNTSFTTAVGHYGKIEIKSFRPIRSNVVSGVPNEFVLLFAQKTQQYISFAIKRKVTTTNRDAPYKQNVRVSVDGGEHYKDYLLTVDNWLPELDIPQGTSSVIIKLIPNAAANYGDKFQLIVASGAYQIPITSSDAITFVDNYVNDVRGSTVTEGESLTYHAELHHENTSIGTVNIDLEPVGIKNVSYSKAVAVFNRQDGSKLGSANLDLSDGLKSLEIPQGTKSIDVTIPTIADTINTKDIKFNMRSWLVSGTAMSASMTLKNKEVAPTVALSVTSSSPVTQSGEFAAGSEDVVFDYKVKADYTNMVPQSYDTLMRVAPEERIAYLVSRAADALTVQIKVSGTSVAKPGKQAMCAFTVSDGDDHAPVPSWLEYELGGVGTWAKRRNDCSGSPLRIDDGYWQQTASDPAKGTKSIELNSRLRFVMKDNSSGFTLERNRFWAGNATGKGTISFELLFRNKAA